MTINRYSGAYVGNWKEIAKAVKDSAGWRCVRCGHHHAPAAGYCLTIHHLTGQKDNNAWWNLAPLCQRCHLSIQGKVIMARPWLLPHSEWFKPYLGGWSAWRYLGLQLTREEVMESLEYYVGLQMAELEGATDGDLV